jgi:hypothetical protein
MEQLEKIAEKNLINYIELNNNHEIEYLTNLGYIREPVKDMIGRMDLIDIVTTIMNQNADNEAGIFHRRDSEAFIKAFMREFRKELKLIKSLN